MIRLLLVGYGEVISTQLPEDTITDRRPGGGRPAAQPYRRSSWKNSSMTCSSPERVTSS